jgi:hypothetical protein
MPDGTTMIVCMRARRPRRCPCGHVALYLCDAPRGPRSARTCDQPLCDACRVAAGKGRDLCRVHGALAVEAELRAASTTKRPPPPAQLALPGLTTAADSHEGTAR